MLRGPLLAVAGLAGLSLGVWVASQLGGFLVAAVVVIYVLAGAGLWGLRRQVRYGSLRRPAKCVKPAYDISTIPAPAALPPPPLALPAGRPVPGVVPARDDCAHVS